VSDWEERATRAVQRYEDGTARLPGDADERQRQLTRMGNAAWAAGLSLRMAGRRDEAAAWLLRAAESYKESWEGAPPDSWGRPIAAMKSRLLAADLDGARADADWALAVGAGGAESPIGLYAAALALLVHGDDAEAGRLAAALRGRDDFPGPVADALAALSAGDSKSYETSVRALLDDFEGRQDFLEDVPVADTVLVLQALAGGRGIAADLASPLLPRS
jgi:hypothetical protein